MGFSSVDTVILYTVVRSWIHNISVMFLHITQNLLMRLELLIVLFVNDLKGKDTFTALPTDMLVMSVFTYFVLYFYKHLE